MSASKRVVIGIPTFRRPEGLRRLLDSLARQRASFTPHVVVADNEGEHGLGLKVVTELKAQGYPLPLTGIAVPQRGISQVRNALMDAAFGTFEADVLAMVDDDERVEPQWIGELIRVLDETQADAVTGAVYSEFEETPPAWTKGQSIYWRKPHSEGLVPMIHGAGNIALARKVYTQWAPRFDEAFSLSGGEDKEFFLRLRKLGARFAFAPEARTYEWIGLSRMTWRWALQRAYRIGNTDMRIAMLHGLTATQWLREFMKAMLAGLIMPVVLVIFAWNPQRRMRALLTLARQAGKVAALFNIHPQVYRTIHGS